MKIEMVLYHFPRTYYSNIEAGPDSSTTPGKDGHYYFGNGPDWPCLS